MEKPFFILPGSFSSTAGKRLVGMGDRIAALSPGLQYDLKKLDEEQGAGEYVAEALLNSLAFAILLFLLLSGLQAMRGDFSMTQLLGATGLRQSLDALSPLAPNAYNSALFFFVALAFFIYNPRLQALKKGEAIDKDLIFALKDMLLQVSSGVTLYGALANAARAKYGAVSREFSIAVKDISAGETEVRALEKMALRAESEYLRQATLQMVNSLRAGSPLDSALKSVIASLSQNQRTQIRNYAAELNLLVLVYMIFAVALPGLGSAVIVILSAFGTVNVTETFFATALLLSVIAQAAIIQLIKTRRPTVHL